MRSWPRWSIVVLGAVVWLCVYLVAVRLLSALMPHGEWAFGVFIALALGSDVFLAALAFALVRLFVKLGAPSIVWLGVVIGQTPIAVYSVIIFGPVLGIDSASLINAAQPLATILLPVLGAYAASRIGTRAKAERLPNSRAVPADARPDSWD